MSQAGITKGKNTASQPPGSTTKGLSRTRLVRKTSLAARREKELLAISTSSTTISDPGAMESLKKCLKGDSTEDLKPEQCITRSSIISKKGDVCCLAKQGKRNRRINLMDFAAVSIILPSVS